MEYLMYEPHKPDDLIIGKSLLTNNKKIDKIEYFDRCILNFMIKNNKQNQTYLKSKKYETV
jgi:hypothetical protein|tara:strand:- start:661 stop:843 length:183 start_codon:yes stop_codon:yes gene_type:complete